MKVLVSIPCLFGYEVIKECLDQIINIPNVDVLCCDNNAESEVKKLLSEYRTTYGIKLWHNKKNEYVNPVWNDFIGYFLDSNYDYLVIMNSDLTLNKDWIDVLRYRWLKNPNEVILPTILDDKARMYQGVRMCADKVLRPTGGTAGVFITMNQQQAELCFPIEPAELKVWFGDNFIFDTLRAAGYVTVIPDNFLAYHHHSYTVQRVEGITEIIEADKVIWETVGKQKLQERINKNKRKV